MNIFLILFVLVNSLLFASDIGVDNLLKDIARKSDLSEKTKLANSGVSFIYTRDDMDRMQIKKLKDILKYTYPFGYNENRFGLVDPLYNSSNLPFSSSQMRVYIDNQELTSGVYGSGLFILGDLNLNWVDHIEIYTQSPTYQYATESTLILIKLYTKSAKRDEGGKVKLTTDSQGTAQINAYYAHELKDWSYFAFVAKNSDKRKKYYNRGTKVSRDKDTTYTVATLKKGNNNILFTAFTQKRGGFLDMSMDGTPTYSQIKADFLHIGYDGKRDDLSYLLSFTHMGTKANMEDDVIPIPVAPFYGLYPIKSEETKTVSNIITGSTNYKINLGNNRLLTGVKYRAKFYKFNEASVNGINLSSMKDKLQTTGTLFFEDRYMIRKNSIITAGLSYSAVNNRNSVQNDGMLMYRLSHIYTTDNFIFKTIYSHTMQTLDPYLIDSTIYLADKTKHYKPNTMNTLLENIIYKKESSKYELIFDYTSLKDKLMPNSQGKLDTYHKKITTKGINARWTYHYNEYDKLFLNAGYRVLENLPSIRKASRYTAVVRNINSYEKFDIFNELFYSRNTLDKKDYYDYSAGVKYHYSDDLTVSLKGTNLFDNAKVGSYYRTDPITFAQLSPIKLPLFDRTIMLSIGYTF